MVQGGDHLRRANPAQRLDEADGVAQVRAHPHLAQGDGDPLQRGIVDGLVAEDVHQRVAHQFAGAELTLGRPGGGAPVIGGAGRHGWARKRPGARIERERGKAGRC